MSMKLWDLVNKYVEATRYFGREMNGLEKAELFNSLKDGGGEEILEMLGTVEEFHKKQDELEAARKLTGAAPQPNLAGGTIWTTDATHYDGQIIGITQSGNSINLKDYPIKLTGGKNE